MTFRRRTVAITIFALIITFMLCLAPFPAAAIGLGVGPSEIEISDAARGGIYEKTIFVFNGNTEETNFELSTSEEIEGWVSFYHPNNREEAISQIAILPNDIISLVARFTIPSDAADSIYQARLLVRSAVPVQQEEGLGNTVMMQLPINVTINIGGTAIIDGKVSAITAGDTEVGLPLNITVDFTNGSNIDISPTIIARIVKGDDQVAEIKHSSTQVKVGENRVITVSWDTKGQREGAYLVQIEVTLARKPIATKEVVINLQPPGSIPVEGEFTGLRYEGTPAVGTTTKIIGSFKNNGGTSVRARLIAEIYTGDTLVDTARTDEVLVAEGQEGMLVTYFKPEQPGSYSIKAQVTFGGKSSEFKELIFNVVESVSSAVRDTGGGTVETANSNKLPIFFTGGLIFLGLAAYLGTRLNRRRKINSQK